MTSTWNGGKTGNSTKSMPAVALRSVWLRLSLSPIALAAAMGSLLAAYNLRDSVWAQTAHWITFITG